MEEEGGRGRRGGKGEEEEEREEAVKEPVGGEWRSEEDKGRREGSDLTSHTTYTDRHTSCTTCVGLSL